MKTLISYIVLIVVVVVATSIYWLKNPKDEPVVTTIPIEVIGSETQGTGEPADIISGEEWAKTPEGKAYIDAQIAKLTPKKPKETQATKRSDDDLGIPMPKIVIQIPDSVYEFSYSDSVALTIVVTNPDTTKSDTTVKKVPVYAEHTFSFDNTVNLWTLGIRDFMLYVPYTPSTPETPKASTNHMVGINFIMTRLSSSVAVNYAYKGYLFGLGYDLLSESMLLTTGLNKNF